MAKIGLESMLTANIVEGGVSAITNNKLKIGRY